MFTFPFFQIAFRQAVGVSFLKLKVEEEKKTGKETGEKKDRRREGKGKRGAEKSATNHF